MASQTGGEGEQGGGPERIYLVDGSGFIFRAYHALPPLSRADGTPVNAVLGFSNMLLKLIEDTRDEGHRFLAVIFDRGRVTFRNDIYPDYKANRPDPPEDLIPQFELIREATRAFNVPCIDMEGYEADDLIATYARLAREGGYEVVIISSDKDLMQLVGEGVSMYDPMKSRPIGAAEVFEKVGVGPDKVIDVQALAGDPTDNGPGVPGIGVKTAAELINTYHDLDNLLAHAEEIKQPKRRENLLAHAELARISRDLVRLRVDAPVADGVEALEMHPPEPETLLAFLRAQGFKVLAAKVESRFAAAGAATAELGIAAEMAPEESKYELIQERAALERWIAAANAEGVVAVDTETTSLDAMRAELVGVSLSLEAGRACYLPLGHRAPLEEGVLDLGDSGAEAPEQIPLDEALALLKPMLEDPAVLKVGQNIKYDVLVLARHGIAVAPVDDTMLISYVLEAGLHGHGMDELSRLHLGHEPISYKEVAGNGKAQITFDREPLERALDYAAEDADITGRLHRVLKPRLLAERLVTVYETLERPLIPVLTAMERAGIRVEAAELARLSKDFARRTAELEREIHGLAGHEFNVGSPKQLGEVLFDEMGLEGGKRGKTGAYATGATVLEGLAGDGHELPARVLDWRQLAKLKSTYTDALQGQINPDTGRVHTSYSMAATTTGRLASSDPNLQNIPVRTEEGRKIRRAFVAEPGHKLLSADYSQIELRLLAHVADIAVLKDAFHDGLDIHALTASQVFGIPIRDLDPIQRRSAKAINFGIIYGISAFGLARQLAIPRGEAAAYIEAYFERYPGIRDYMEATKELCRRQGYVETIYGRRCHLPGIKDKNPARRGFSERAAINAPLQGSAADIIRRAMIRMPDALREAGLKAVMLLQVHDELIFEVPEGEAEECAEVARRVMASAAHLEVPLVVDTGLGDNWEEAH
ncbi:MAG: DNA polymerase I [Alphaproteobacteria bacterium]